MKALHIVNFLIIFLALLGIVIAEDVIVSSSLSEIQSYCLEIENLVDEKDNLKNMEVVMKVENLEYSWQEDESKLCYLVNHKNIQEIGQEVSKLKLYIASDDVDAFRVSLSTIRGYCHGYLHFMGANIHNVL